VLPFISDLVVYGHRRDEESCRLSLLRFSCRAALRTRERLLLHSPRHPMGYAETFDATSALHNLETFAS
jgi:hypothetical protein